jgi:dTMP kinase
MCRYICLEGTEGVGKTTQTDLLVSYLRSKGFKVLQTKEPGSPHSPLTMELRKIMLDNKYDKELTMAAREFVSQAIRSIHLEKVILPALTEYDFIVQDRGILSGLAYGSACGNDVDFLCELAEYVCQDEKMESPFSLYSDLIYLKGDAEKGLSVAKSAKQEFATGDAMESRGNKFINNVSKNMDNMSQWFDGTHLIEVSNKGIEQVFQDILDKLKV